ncbi:MAG: phospho-N-acetylmuramoyl-pentapeptide-transferase [Oscillospiraceae bacterium]|jgi:phospho-N-acetylmuramoyl-pentapeptide-transferase
MERTSLIVTAVTSVLVTALLGIVIVPWLKKKKLDQVINDIGPTWHQKKAGTPSMGGIMIVFGVIISLAVGILTLYLRHPQIMNDQYFEERMRLVIGLCASLCFGAIGFTDDMMKIKNNRNLGLTAKKKLIPQTIIATAYVVLMHFYGGEGTDWVFPLIGTLRLGWFYYPLSIFTIVGFVNAVNLTDGLDGLNSTVTFFYSAAMVACSAVAGYAATGLFAAAVAGACAGFLVWNFYPAKIFMGDTGSLFLGGAVISMAFGISYPVLLFVAGIVYLCEAFSVILQVCYFKATHGKRLFKMSPIHHHFEMCGWSEIKIDAVFGLVTVLGGAVSVILLAAS